MFSKALGSWLYQIGAFATVVITLALIPVRPAASGFTLHKILCLCQVRTLNGAVKGIQVPLHLTWALIPGKPAAWCFYPTQNTMFTPGEDLKEGCFGYSGRTPPHMSPYSNKKPSGWGFTRHKLLCLHQVRTLNRAVLGIQVPHLGPVL